MPDHQPLDELSSIESKSQVQNPGIDPFPSRQPRTDDGPLRICWNARWEHDKNPEDFFAALRILKTDNVPFRLIVLGESFRNSPDIFESSRNEFAAEIDQWGYARTTEEYRSLLARADVIVSTANHEFFGIGIVEGIAAGAWPVVPNRLAYPEVIAHLGTSRPAADFLYDGTLTGLVGRLRTLCSARETLGEITRQEADATRFHWANRAAEMDSCLDQLAS
jgi:glycosyltransferase involved in cell wall biosynthesis